MKTNRNISGVLVLNKDSGHSSNHALQKAKRLFQAAKAGHTGSLDPLACGVLPICFGEATKFSRFILDADKTYQVTAQLGVTTTTGDAEGEVIKVCAVPQFSSQDLLQTIKKFKGATKQIPSMYSALKHNGQPLYKLARQNLTVERAARDIYVYEYELLDHAAEYITCKIKCSKGTYIRNLIEDLGAVLGCGAHVTALQRTQAGPFVLEKSFSLEQLSNTLELDSLLLPLETLIKDLPAVHLNAIDTQNLIYGKVVSVQYAGSGTVALINPRNSFMGIGEAGADGTLVAKRLLAQ